MPRPHDRIFIRLDITPDRDRQTDRRADKSAVAITALALRAMRSRCVSVYTREGRSHACIQPMCVCDCCAVYSTAVRSVRRPLRWSSHC